MNKIEKEQFWFNHYKKFKSTKMTQKVYAEAHLLKHSQFRNWVRKFRLLENKRIGGVIVSKRPSAESRAMFLPVSVSSNEPKGRAIVLKVIVRDLVLEFDELPEPSWLMRLSQTSGAR